MHEYVRTYEYTQTKRFLLKPIPAGFALVPRRTSPFHCREVWCGNLTHRSKERKLKQIIPVVPQIFLGHLENKLSPSSLLHVSLSFWSSVWSAFYQQTNSRNTSLRLFVNLLKNVTTQIAFDVLGSGNRPKDWQYYFILICKFCNAESISDRRNFPDFPDFKAKDET